MGNTEPRTPAEPLAWQFVDQLPQAILDHHISNVPGEPTFDNTAIEVIADELQDFIAYVIATLIDAGSERDAVNEDEQLALAIRHTLKDW